MFRSTHSRTAFLAASILSAGYLAASSARVIESPNGGRSRFTVEIGPVNLPGSGNGHGLHVGSGEHAHTNAVTPPVSEVRVPVNAYVNGFQVSIHDGSGEDLPLNLIHHLNFIDPENRELFLPISQRMLAVGKETGSHSFPTLLFGYPLKKGQRMIVSAMLHNPHAADYSDVRIRVSFLYSPAKRPWPLFPVYPFQMDVMFPHGDKSFDLPPGRSERSYDASPVIAGRIMALSGHVHEYATSLSLRDVTRDKLLWEGKPTLNSTGEVAKMPVTSFVSKFGVRLSPRRVYRVTVVYENPTGETLEDGGMGVIGGIFLPGLGRKWPRADTRDKDYGLDRAHYMQQNKPHIH